MKAIPVVLQLPNPRGCVSKLHGDPLRSQDLWDILWKSFHGSFFLKKKKGKREKLRIICYPTGFHTAVESWPFLTSPCGWIQPPGDTTLGDRAVAGMGSSARESTVSYSARSLTKKAFHYREIFSMLSNLTQWRYSTETKNCSKIDASLIFKA